MPTLTPRPFRLELLQKGFWLGVVEVSPTAAAQLLELNTKNRKLRNLRIVQYAEAMRQGRWGLVPDCLSVEAGVLVNGQHRLRAVVLAEVSAVFGLMVDGGTRFDTTDNGATRTGADVLFLSGLSEYPAAVAQACRLLAKASGEPWHIFNDNRYLETYALERPELIAKVNMLEALARSDKGLGGTLAVPLAVLCYAAVDRGLIEAADRFADRMMSGVGLTKGEPVDVLRNQIIKRLSTPTLHRYHAPELLELLTTALEAELEGRRPGTFRYRGTGWKWAPYKTGISTSALSEP